RVRSVRRRWNIISSCAPAWQSRVRLRNRPMLSSGHPRTTFHARTQTGDAQMMKRQPDGTWRNTRRPLVASPEILRARWIEAEELHKLDNARSEEMFLNLQPDIRKGNLRAIEVGIRVLDHSAKINGHAAPQRHELTGKDGKPLTLVQLLDAVGEIGDDE